MAQTCCLRYCANHYLSSKARHFVTTLSIQFSSTREALFLDYAFDGHKYPEILAYNNTFLRHFQAFQALKLPKKCTHCKKDMDGYLNIIL